MIYRSLGVASEPSQECLPHFRESPNGESPGCSQESLSLFARVTWCPSCTVLSGHLSLVGCDCWDGRPFLCLYLHGDVTETKRDAFLPVGDSQYPPSTAYRLRMGSGMSWEPLSDSPLGYILRNWKFLTLQKAWPQYKLHPNPQKQPLNGTLAFVKSRERTQNFLRFTPLWPSVRIQI